MKSIFTYISILLIALLPSTVISQDIEITNYNLQIVEGSHDLYGVDPPFNSKTTISPFDFVRCHRNSTATFGVNFSGFIELFISRDTIIDGTDFKIDKDDLSSRSFRNALFGKNYQIRCDEFPGSGEFYIINRLFLTNDSNGEEFEDIRVDKIRFIRKWETPLMVGEISPYSNLAPTGKTIFTDLKITNSSAQDRSPSDWNFYLGERSFDINSATLLKTDLIGYPEMEEGEYPFETNFHTILPGETKTLRNYPIEIPANTPSGEYYIYAISLFNTDGDIECLSINTSSFPVNVSGPQVQLGKDTLKVYSTPNQEGIAVLEIKNIGGGELLWEIPNSCPSVEPIDKFGTIQSQQNTKAELLVTVGTTDEICMFEVHSNSEDEAVIEVPVQIIITDSVVNVTASIEDSLFCTDRTLSLTYNRPSGFPFSSTNRYYVELSDSLGSFANATVLATGGGTRGGTRTFELSDDVDVNQNYFIRVRSTVPVFFSQPISLANLGAPAITQVNTTLSIPMSPNATYQWLDCDNNYAAVTGATSSSFTPAQQGSYSVVISKNGCVDTTDCFNYMTSSVIEQADQLLSVAPNPTNDQITVTHPSLPIEKIEILSLSGNVLKTFEPNHNPIGISELPPAVYFIKVVSKEKTLVRKIIKL